MIKVVLGILALSLVGCGDQASITEVQSAQGQSTYLIISQTTDNTQLKPPHEPDWAPNFVKTECGSPAGLAIGISYFGTGSSVTNHRLDCNNAGWYVSDVDRVVLNVRSQNDDRQYPNLGYDWAPGYFKGSCPNGYGISGIATDSSGMHGLGYIKCSLVGFHTPNNIGGFVSQNIFPHGSPIREYASEPAATWDSGYNLDQCGDGRFLTGLAHGPYQFPVYFMCSGDPYGTFE